MQMLEESLTRFGQLAADALDELMGLGASFATDEADDSQAALGRYIALVQTIGQAADSCGLEGMQSVCASVETNLLLLQDENRTLHEGERALLEEWPMLLFGYLANQADISSSTALLRNLAGAWPLPLPEDSAQDELRLLTLVPQETVAVAAPPEESITPVAAPDTEIPSPAPPADSEQHVDREMIAILAQELGSMHEQLAEELEAVPHTPHALVNYIELLQRLALTVDSIGLTALAALLTGLSQQLAHLNSIVTPAQQALLQSLPRRIDAYLAAPNEGEACGDLVQLLADSAWPAPVTAVDIPLWTAALAHVELTAESGARVERPATATQADVSLALPEEVNPELLETLLQELPAQTGAFTGAIGNLAQGNGSLKDLKLAMRAAHTLKGAANTVGVPGIANLTHHLEDILVALIDAEKLPQRRLAEMLVNASDCLEAMSESLQGLGPPPTQAQAVLQEVLDCANRIDREGLSGAEVAESPVAAPELKHDEEEAPAVPAVPAEQVVRIPASLTDELLRLAGESLTSNTQAHERLRLSRKQSEIIREQHRLIQQLIGELEVLVDIRGITSPQGKARTEAEFDALEFEQYSELHTVTHRLVEASTDARELADEMDGQLTAMDELLAEQLRLQQANQHAVMRTRMVPVSSVVARLQRSVRQTGRLLDKQVVLTVKGEHTSIDSHVLNDLMDPLMHILRNAVDHGIETPEDRVIAGKPAQGNIELSFAREGNAIVVRCRDDGAGLDFAAIRRIAERKGMLKSGREQTEDDLARLILAPGFSTRDETSLVSGRGVGMDVVHSRVVEMKGMLALNSRRGEGLIVEMRLPASLLSAHTLIVRQREKRLAISSRGVEDIRYVTREQIMEIGPRQFLRDGEAMVGLSKLENLLSMPHDRRAKDRHGFPVLLTRLENGKLSAVLVQEIIDSREVVMKNFTRYVPRVQGVVGAVMMGDGGVAPVIDLVELLRTPAQRALGAEEAEQLPAAEPKLAQKQLHALVVDDSLSARRAVVQVLKDAGYDVRTANDGLDAVNILEKYVPDIMLVDMEMPRMNGLELASHVRHSERTKHVPIIMITSRTTEKHRQMSTAAGVNVHVTKPFNDDVLLKHVAQLTKR